MKYELVVLLAEKRDACNCKEAECIRKSLSTVSSITLTMCKECLFNYLNSLSIVELLESYLK